MVKFFLISTSYCTNYGQAGIILKRFQFKVKGHIISLIIKNITIITVWQKLCIFQLVRILVAGFVIFGEVWEFHLKDTIFRCSSNINLDSSISPRWFWDDDWETLVLLNVNSRWYISFDLQLKMNLGSCLAGSGLKSIFHQKS